MITAHIIVTPKRSVLDPQGEAVKNALHSLGLSSATAVRVGKFIELDLDLENSEKNQGLARQKLEAVCQDLLSNPVIEDYQLSFLSAAKAPVPTPAPVAPAKIVSLQAHDEGLKEMDDESTGDLVRLEVKPKKALKKLAKIEKKIESSKEVPKAVDKKGEKKLKKKAPSPSDSKNKKKAGLPASK